VSRFARSLERTGVGFYPNSVFTHVDVRHRQAYWIDRSAPGEPADYGPWPPKGQEVARLRNRVLASVDDALAALRSDSDDHEPRSPSQRVTATDSQGTATAPQDDANDQAAPAASARLAAVSPAGEQQPAADGIGGLLSASGVRAAWSSVPDPRQTKADNADGGKPSAKQNGSSTRARRQHAAETPQGAAEEQDGRSNRARRQRAAETPQGEAEEQDRPTRAQQEQARRVQQQALSELDRLVGPGR
jgi:hypothetical protein